jgi:hypothetical protein
VPASYQRPRKAFALRGFVFLTRLILAICLIPRLSFLFVQVSLKPAVSVMEQVVLVFALVSSSITPENLYKSYR